MAKGLLDQLVGTILIVILAIVIVAVYFFATVMMNAFGTTPADPYYNITLQMRVGVTAFINSFNTGFLVAYIGMLIGICGLSYFTDVHPMFFPLSIIIAVLTIAVSFFLSDAYYEITRANADLLASAETNWIVDNIMRSLPFWTTIFNLIIIYFTYAHKRGGGNIG